MIRHPRILVVDDSPTSCFFIATTLEQAGYKIDVAFNGQEGLAKVMRGHIDCLLLDAFLPDMSGFAICRQIRHSPLQQSIPIIFISSKAAPLDQRYGLRQGAQRYLPKPFTADTLLKVVREVIPEPVFRTVAPVHASTQRQQQPELLKLIPRRLADQNAMRTNNPLSSFAVIKDEQARRLYATIDGKKTVSELAAVVGLEVKEVARALHVLHKEKRIQLHDPAAGRPVEHAL